MLLLCFIAKFGEYCVPGNVCNEASKWLNQCHIKIILPYLLGREYFNFLLLLIMRNKKYADATESIYYFSYSLLHYKKVKCCHFPRLIHRTNLDKAKASYIENDISTFSGLKTKQLILC